MIFKYEHNPLQEDIEILLTYPERNKTVDNIILFMNSVDTQIECHSETGVKGVNISDIYYIESVEKVTDVFCENEKYRTKYRLYQLYEELADKGFIQISKYCILNINKIDRIRPLFNSRVEAVLTNGKHLFITGKYRLEAKRKLKGEYLK
jgi:DNA-binding LytR/AlgR family response regulator